MNDPSATQPGAAGGAEGVTVDATLKSAHRIGNTIWGHIYDDKKGRFPDGHYVHTSSIIEELPGGIFRTRNSTYRVEFFGTPASPPAQREDSQTPMTPEAEQSIPDRFPATMAHLAKSETPQGSIEWESLVDAFLKEALGRVTAYDNEPDEPVTRYELIALINVLQRKLDKGGV